MLKQEDEINTGKAEQDAMKSKLVQSEGALVELESARNFLQEKCNKYEQRIFDVENEHAKCGLAIEELNRRAKETGEKHDVYSKEIDVSYELCKYIKLVVLRFLFNISFMVFVGHFSNIAMYAGRYS